MKTLVRLARNIRSLGSFSRLPATIEDALVEIGFEIERRRLETETIHADGFAEKIDRAFDWAAVSGLSLASRNYYLDEGARNARGR